MNYTCQYVAGSELTVAAAVESRKRCARLLVNEDDPFRDLVKRDAKRGRHIFPDATTRDLKACFATSGGDIHATAQAYWDQQAAKQALAARLVHGGVDECAGILVEQMAAASDVSDARNRASWILGLINDANAAEAARLREENGALREEATRLREENGALREEAARLRRERAAAAEQDNAVLKRDVLAVPNEAKLDGERTVDTLALVTW